MLFGVTRWAGSFRQPRMSVFAYDIASPKRARRVRRVLAGLRCDGQYSVCETHLTVPEMHDLLAELWSLCDPDSDRLASWRPRDERVLALDRKGRLLLRAGAGGDWRPAPDRRRAAGGGNFVICYDIADVEALLAVGRKVAACTTAMQRSVYWLRGTADDLLGLAHQCAPLLGETDKLWIYPLASASHLWQVRIDVPCILPVAVRGAG